MTHSGKPNGITAWITKRPAASFYAIALTLSWGYWLTLLAIGLRVEPGSNVTHFPGLLGPMFAAVIVTAVIGGSSGLRELLERVFYLGSTWPSKLIRALSPLVLGVAAFAAMHVLDNSLPTAESFSHFPCLPEHWPLVSVVLAVVLVNGFGEETGWRGFLSEHLLATQGRFPATVVVALLWAFWHLPLFWLSTGMAALVGPILIGWLFALVCGAFVLAQVYVATGRSILCVALWHAAYNMMVATDNGTRLPATIVGTLVMIWGVIVAICWWRTSIEPTERTLPP